MLFRSEGQLGIWMATTPVIEPLQQVPLSPNGPLAACRARKGCLERVRSMLTIAQGRALIVMDASLPTASELHQDAFYLESRALDEALNGMSSTYVVKK